MANRKQKSKQPKEINKNPHKRVENGWVTVQKVAISAKYVLVFQEKRQKT